MAFDRTVAETIETLTERLQTSTLLEDRRDACRGLRSLARDYRVEVGAQAMDLLLHTIKNDNHDIEIIHFCLDSLNYIISGQLADSPTATWTDPDTSSFPTSNNQTTTSSANLDTSRANHANQQSKHDPGNELSEIFLKNSKNLSSIVGIITGHDDFKTRWVVVKILFGLARFKLSVVQDAILSDPMNLPQLSQLVTEEHELIRNDALVLFVRITQSNQNIQNVLAYDNFYDKIMYIIELEGYLEGTVAVVNDCLEILFNLLQNNDANQKLFREVQIPKLLPFFNSIQTIQWTFEKTTCVTLVLQILDCMVSSTNSPEDVRRSQEIMHRCGILDKLCEMLAASSMPIGIMSETMNTASDIVKGHLGPNAGIVVQTSSMMPILLLGMVKEMVQDQEKRMSDLYEMVKEMVQDQERRMLELYDYVHRLHDFVAKSK